MEWWQVLLLGAGATVGAEVVVAALFWVWRGYHKALVARVRLFFWPVAYDPPRIELDRSSISLHRHTGKDGEWEGYSLRVKLGVHNRDKGEVSIYRGGMDGRLVSHTDPRRTVSIDSSPFADTMLLSSRGAGARLPSITIGSKRKAVLDIGMVSGYEYGGGDLPGDRINVSLVVRVELTPRPGRNLAQHYDALRHRKTLSFRLRASDAIEEIDNWLATKVALAREIGASEDDIEDGLLPRRWD